MFDAEARAKAVAARNAKIQAGAKYRRDFMDSGLWDELARTRGIRLPAWWVAPTGRALISWHRKLVGTPFQEVYGCNPSRLIALNPTFPLRAFIGHMLEMK